MASKSKSFPFALTVFFRGNRERQRTLSEQS